MRNDTWDENLLCCLFRRGDRGRNWRRGRCGFSDGDDGRRLDLRMRAVAGHGEDEKAGASKGGGGGPAEFHVVAHWHISC